MQRNVTLRSGHARWGRWLANIHDMTLSQHGPGGLPSPFSHFTSAHRGYRVRRDFVGCVILFRILFHLPP